MPTYVVRFDSRQLLAWLGMASLALTLAACRTFPSLSAANNAGANSTASNMASPKLQVPPNQAMITGAYSPPLPAPNAVQPVAHQADCGCGRRHGRGSAGCSGEEFRFSHPHEHLDAQSQWAPDGIKRPWPQDEYIWDGGDHGKDARISKQNVVIGLDQEDTIIHYDTAAGKTEVAASNRVPLYAPRFAAVRTVIALEENNKSDRLAQADKELPVGEQGGKNVVTNMNQPVQVVNQLGIGQSQIFRERNSGIVAETTRHIAQAHSELLAYEQFRIIRQGIMDAGEKPRLSQAMQSAIAWTDNKMVQVVIDGKMAHEAVKNDKIGETILYDRHGKPEMRIVKIADKSEAKPGEIVHFTLRFDNIGTDTVDKVAIIDNLTTRLEYVPDTQECDLPHAFATNENEGETLVLRWELEEPIPAGKGGLIRFQCRVR
jgi:uncharacterized repeat protein (TIGR01451 family)